MAFKTRHSRDDAMGDTASHGLAALLFRPHYLPAIYGACHDGKMMAGDFILFRQLLSNYYAGRGQMR